MSCMIGQGMLDLKIGKSVLFLTSYCAEGKESAEKEWMLHQEGGQQ